MLKRIIILIFAILFLNCSCFGQPLKNHHLFGIICAIEQEAAPILEEMKNVQTINVQGIKFHKGKISNKNVILLVGGVGSINAAISTALLIKDFQPTCVLFSGSAGRVEEKLNIGDVVVSHSLYDLDYGDPNYSTPTMKLSFPNPISGINDPIYFFGDKQLLSLLPKVSENLFLKPAHNDRGEAIKAKIVEGILATSNHFPNDDRDLNRMQKNNVQAVSMEGVGVMKACWLFKKPCLIVRGISNAVGSNINNPYLNWNVTNQTLAECNAAQVTINMVKFSP
jgi:adenosylhomocysteine nucleosidase